MKILLTGATGYIAQRLLPVLAGLGHSVICCVRDRKRFHYDLEWQDLVSVVEVDFLDPESLAKIPDDIDAISARWSKNPSIISSIESRRQTRGRSYS